MSVGKFVPANRVTTSEQARTMTAVPAGTVYKDGVEALEIVGSLPTICQPSGLRRILERTLGYGWGPAKPWPPTQDPELMHVDDRTVCRHGLKKGQNGPLWLCRSERTIMSTAGILLDQPEWKMRVIVTAGDFGKDGCWQHASISRADRLPSYDELKTLHIAAFNGGYSYQVFTPPADHVNIHAFALHLWGKIDGSMALPDFGALGVI